VPAPEARLRLPVFDAIPQDDLEGAFEFRDCELTAAVQQLLFIPQAPQSLSGGGQSAILWFHPKRLQTGQ